MRRLVYHNSKNDKVYYFFVDEGNFLQKEPYTTILCYDGVDTYEILSKEQLSVMEEEEYVSMNERRMRHRSFPLLLKL